MSKRGHAIQDVVAAIVNAISDSFTNKNIVVEANPTITIVRIAFKRFSSFLTMIVSF